MGNTRKIRKATQPQPEVVPELDRKRWHPYNPQLEPGLKARIDALSSELNMTRSQKEYLLAQFLELLELHNALVVEYIQYVEENQGQDAAEELKTELINETRKVIDVE